MQSSADYQEYKYMASVFYSNINSIFSPALKNKIGFPAESFNHIIFKNSRSERERSSQMLRFKLLPLAVKLIGVSTTYQEYEESMIEMMIKRHKKRTKSQQKIIYWGIIAIIDGQKIKVILRKIGTNGSIHFWSIIPAWVTNKYRDTIFYTTMKGSPAED